MIWLYHDRFWALLGWVYVTLALFALGFSTAPETIYLP